MILSCALIWKHQRLLPRLGTRPSAPTTSPGAVRAGAALQVPASVVPVFVYSVFTGGDCGAHIDTESVLILTKSSVVFSERLLRGAERLRLRCGRERFRLRGGRDRVRPRVRRLRPSQRSSRRPQGGASGASAQPARVSVRVDYHAYPQQLGASLSRASRRSKSGKATLAAAT